MQSFRSLDDADVKGKRVLLARRPQRADGDGKVVRLHPHRRNRADHHRARRQGRQGHPAVAFQPSQEARSERFAAAGRRRSGADRQAAGRVRRGLRRPAGASRRRRNEGRRHSLSGKHPLPSRGRKQRQGIRQEARRAGRHFRRRRVFGRPPRARLEHRDRHRVEFARLSGPRHEEGARRAGESLRDAAASGHRDRRRRQDFDQARSARASARQGRDAGHRRRHGQYVPGGAGQGGGQVAVRTRAGRQGRRHHGQGEVAWSRDRAADRRRGGAETGRSRRLAGRRGRRCRRQPT